MLTRNKRTTPAHASVGSGRRLRSPAALVAGLGIVGLLAVAMIPQGASATSLSGVSFVRSPATASSLYLTIQDPAITESSGLAVSGYSSSRLWTHNDSGGGTYLYALGTDGRTTGTFNLGDVSHKDWEGMAQYQDGATSYLYRGDIGDNGKKRDSIFVHRVVEPAASATGGTLKAETFEFKYSDGKHNAEAMMVNPADHRVYIITKSSPAGIYQAPASLSTTSVNVLTKIASVPAGLSDAVYLDSKRFVLRGYVSGWLFPSIGGTATRFPLPIKGESISKGFSSSYVFIGSEHVHSKIYKVALP